MSVRLLPDEPFPPYTYVPGRAPHPVTDPRGHMYGHRAEAATRATPALAPDDRALLRGIDLFNAGYYWEAHEAWEGAWHAVGRAGAAGDWLKGLIKLAAAGVKAYEGRLEGVRRHAARGAELFARAAAGELPEWAAAELPALKLLAESIYERAHDAIGSIAAPPVPGLVGSIAWRHRLR